MRKAFLVVFVLAVVLAGCSVRQVNKEQAMPSREGAVSAGNAAVPQAPVTHEVEIIDFAYFPAELTVRKGDVVVWANRDSALHTVSSESGSELDSGTLSKDGSYSHTFMEEGVFSYYCVFHPYMSAKVVVS